MSQPYMLSKEEHEAINRFFGEVISLGELRNLKMRDRLWLAKEAGNALRKGNS